MPRLQPGQIPFSEMDARQSARWCKEQILAADDGSVGTPELQDGAVTLAKFQQVTANRLLGRLSTDGTLEQLTATQVASLLQAVAWAFSTTVTFTGNVGFFGHSAVAQQSSSVAVTPTTISGTGDDSNINANFVALANAVNTLRTALLNLGLTG